MKLSHVFILIAIMFLAGSRFSEAAVGDVIFSDLVNHSDALSVRWQGDTGGIYYDTSTRTIGIKQEVTDMAFNATVGGSKSSGVWMVNWSFYDDGSNINPGMFVVFGGMSAAPLTVAAIGSGVCNQAQGNYRLLSDNCGNDTAERARSIGWHKASVLINFTANRTTASIDGSVFATSAINEPDFSRFVIYANPGSPNFRITNILVCDTFCPTIYHNLTIQAPLTASPVSVTGGQEISVNFTPTIWNINLTVENQLNITNVSVGGLVCTIPTTIGTEAQNLTLFQDGFEGGNISNRWDKTSSGYVNATDQVANQLQSAKLASSLTSKFIWINQTVNTTDCGNISVQFLTRDDDLDAGDLNVWFNDSSNNWDFMIGLTALTEDAWIIQNITNNETQYKHGRFSVRFGNTTASGENHWLDAVVVSCAKNVTLEVQEYHCYDKTFCQVNCTVPLALSGLQDLDLAVNYTIDGFNMNDTEVDCVDYGSSISYCYQEFANTSSLCGGIGTGKYNFTGAWTDAGLVIDGDYATEGGAAALGGVATLLINYTKPGNVTNLSLWQVKDNGGTFNLSINNSNCWTSYNNKLVLRVNSTNPVATQEVNWACYNSTNWILLRQRTGVVGADADVYEEGVYWASLVNTSCIYPGGNWSVSCQENCSIVDNVNVENNSVLFNGTGKVTLLANITDVGARVRVQNACVLRIGSGGGLR